MYVRCVSGCVYIYIICVLYICEYILCGCVCVYILYMCVYVIYVCIYIMYVCKFWQGKNIKRSVFRTCILITQNTEQVLRISELLSVIQNSYIYGNHGNLKMELTLPVPSCYQSLTVFRRL